MIFNTTRLSAMFILSYMGLIILTVPAVSAQVTEKKEPTRRDLHQLAPPISGKELLDRVLAAQMRGFDFLVKTQNSDGSWGSHDPKIPNLADFGFRLRNRGSQDGVRLACTAICATALLEKKSRKPSEEKALQLAIDVLMRDDKFAYHKGESFNIWGYGYKLDFLSRLFQSSVGADRKTAIKAAAQTCILGLKRFQQADGGWNYYSGPMMGRESMSFTTANFIIALNRARKVGFDVPPGLLEDSVKILQKMRTVRGGFMYDARFINRARAVNELSAGGRTAVAAIALHDVGVFKRTEMIRSMEIFDEGENYLEDGRKLIQPHTAVHQVSGYFYFYGQTYAAELAARLGSSVTSSRWDRFAWTMVRTQESNGSWWDTPASYGDKWGTGFALQVINYYFEHLEYQLNNGDSQ